jgi:glycosyltransferase involved in cell wall biosynthesis
MRILVVSNTPFLPATAGNRARIGQMVKFYRERGADIGMLMLPDGDVSQWDIARMKAVVSPFEVASPPRSRLRYLAPRSVRRLFWRAHARAKGLPEGERPPGAPLGIDDWCPPWFRDRAAQLVKEWAPDVLLIEYVFLSACCEALDEHRRPVTVIDTHDVMHKRESEYTRAGLPVGWFHTSYAEERLGLGRADIVLAIQETDAQLIRRMVPDATVLVAPHGSPITPPSLDVARPSRLLFVGSNNDFNRSGLQWFLREAWPQLKREVPEVDLVVCGSVAECLGATPADVAVRGVVPTLAPEYAQARLVINPMQGGTGLKVKTAEALCHGRPVVSTPAGAVGFATGDANGVLIADTAHAFVSTVRGLLSDAPRWARLAAGAASQAASRFSPDAAFGELFDVVADRVAQRRSRRSA